MEQLQKAWDTLMAANLARQDLSAVISLQDGPIRPLLQAQTLRNNVSVPKIGTTPSKGKIHYWPELPLVAATGSSKGFQEGGKPVSDQNVPVMITNTVARIGAVAAVTDEEAAEWTGSGSFSLADGEMERLYRESLDLATVVKTTEVLNEWELEQNGSLAA